jgi:hypothetical protein
MRPDSQVVKRRRLRFVFFGKLGEPQSSRQALPAARQERFRELQDKGSFLQYRQPQLQFDAVLFSLPTLTRRAFWRPHL